MTMSDAAQAESERLTEHSLTEEIPAEALDGAVKPWSKDGTYWLVALILGLITAVEVSTYTNASFWQDFPGLGDIMVPSLLFMMAVKFFMVTWFFMHLKSDNKVLTQVFYFGLVLAVFVYVVALATLKFF